MAELKTIFPMGDSSAMTMKKVHSWGITESGAGGEFRHLFFQKKSPGYEFSFWQEKDVSTTHQGEIMDLNSKEQPTSPQKQGVKARSKSTEEIQPAKKAFHTPQKSLPNQMDSDESKGSCSLPSPNTAQQQQT